MPVRAPTSRSAASLQALWADGEADPEVVRCAEDAAGHDRNVCLLQQPGRQVRRCLPGPGPEESADVGEGEHPAAGSRACDAGHRAERVHQQVTVAAVLLDRRAGGRTVAQRCQRGVLGDEAGRG